LAFKTKYEEDLFKNRYARRGDEECWDDVFKRVADYVTEDELDRERYFKMMSEGWFLPGSPQLWNYGVPGEGSGSSCFVYDIDDTLESIWKSDEVARDVFKSSGGVGFVFDKLRPRGCDISNSPNPAVGIRPVVGRIERTTGYITAGGRARGAFMAALSCDHPDIIEFILAKRPIDRGNGELDLPLTQCNMSVRCSDLFMGAIENDKEWYLHWHNDNTKTDNPYHGLTINTWEEYREIWSKTLNEQADPQSAFFYYKTLLPAIEHLTGTIYAHQIWDLIVDNAWNHADPGVMFCDELERRNTTPSMGVLGANPCGEALLPVSGDACNLGSLNLAKIFTQDLPWKTLKKYTRLTVRYLNDSLSVNKIPIEQIDTNNKESKRIGLGFTGLHDALILQGLKYDSQEGREFAARIMATIELTAWSESIDIGNERGDQSIHLDRDAWVTRIDKYVSQCNRYHRHSSKRAPWKSLAKAFKDLSDTVNFDEVLPMNATVTSIAPTGSLTYIFACISDREAGSYGCEPVQYWTTHRKDNNGATTVNHWLKDVAFENDMQDQTAEKISWEDHIAMQAAVSDFCSMGVSKTINLPESATREDVSAAYMLAWKLGIPGTTVYRNNSKPFQVLSSEPLEGSVINSEPSNVSAPALDTRTRPERLHGFTEKVPVVLGTGVQKNVYVTINETDGKPYEVFFSGLNRDEMQDPIARELATVGRLVSMAMRYGVPVGEIMDQLEKIDGQHLFSLPTKLSKLLTTFVDKDSKGNAQLHCKQCKKLTPHQMMDGCKTCLECNTSAC
jgi:ribonucleoside-diphosphate reductase alpha chain